MSKANNPYSVDITQAKCTNSEIIYIYLNMGKILQMLKKGAAIGMLVMILLPFFYIPFIIVEYIKVKVKGDKYELTFFGDYHHWDIKDDNWTFYLAPFYKWWVLLFGFSFGSGFAQSWETAEFGTEYNLFGLCYLILAIITVLPFSRRYFMNKSNQESN